MRRIKLVVLLGLATLVLGWTCAGAASAKSQLLELRTSAGPIETGERIGTEVDELTIQTNLGNYFCYADEDLLNGALQTNNQASDELAIFEAAGAFDGKEYCETSSGPPGKALLTLEIKGSSGGFQVLGGFHLTYKGKLEFKPSPNLDFHMSYAGVDCYYTFTKFKGTLAGIDEARFLSFEFVKQHLKLDRADSAKACATKTTMSFEGGFMTAHHGYASGLARPS